MSRRHFGWLLIPLAVLIAISATSGPSRAAATVYVFPIPGSKVLPPGAQIAFRGIPVSQIGSVSVVGSQSGNHSGRLAGDSDGHGGSFIPKKQFTPGETVTVKTGLDVAGASGGTFSYIVASPAGRLPIESLLPAPRVRGDVSHFHSRSDLAPVRLSIGHSSSHVAPGDIFVAPQHGPLQNGPMLLDQNGNLVWFKPLASKTWATDVRAQRYQGKPVLTWWQGNESAGTGVGTDVISDSSYTIIKYVNAVGGLHADLHDFYLTPRGTALITSFYPVYWDASAVTGGIQHQIVLDGVVQEIDVKTGLLLFQWDSLDHVPLTDSYTAPPRNHGHPFDYFHINSVMQDSSQNLVISGRNTWTVYGVDHNTGVVDWRLGGKSSTIKEGAGTTTAWQHDAIPHAGGVLSVFDNGAGPPKTHPHSRALLLQLNTQAGTVSLIREFDHTPALSANFEGNVETLPGGDVFGGWGQQPYFTEFDSTGHTLFDARFADGNTSYRAYKFRWTGTPHTRPAIAAAIKGRSATVWMSWNGATQVAAWRVLAGSSPERAQGRTDGAQEELRERHRDLRAAGLRRGAGARHPRARARDVVDDPDLSPRPAVPQRRRCSSRSNASVGHASAARRARPSSSSGTSGWSMIG